jgi:hypothetical protein
MKMRELCNTVANEASITGGKSYKSRWLPISQIKLTKGTVLGHTLGNLKVLRKKSFPPPGKLKSGCLRF